MFFGGNRIKFDLKNDRMKDCTERNGGDNTLGRPASDVRCQCSWGIFLLPTITVTTAPHWPA